jgi:hypothetical protein
VLTVSLLGAWLAASPTALEITADAAQARSLPDGRRVVLVVTAHNPGRNALVFLPQAVSLVFNGEGARLQRYDEGPPLPPLCFEARTLPEGASARLELVAMTTDSTWQIPAGGGQRANWFLRRPGRYRVEIRYAVRESTLQSDAPCRSGPVWKGELVIGPVEVDLP